MNTAADAAFETDAPSAGPAVRTAPTPEGRGRFEIDLSARRQATPQRRPRHRSVESRAGFKGEMLAYAKQRYRDQGYEAVSIRAVTDAFGMSPMSFYGYFDSKRDLIKHILLDCFQALLEQLQLAGAEPSPDQGPRSPHEMLAAHALAHIDYWEARPDDYRMAYVSNLGISGDDRIRFDDEPVYQQLSRLAGERIRACASGRPFSDLQVEQLRHCMNFKVLGYLHLTLAVHRHELAERAELKRMMVDDIIAMARRAVARG